MRTILAGRTSAMLLVLAAVTLSLAGCGRGNAFKDGQAAYLAKDFTKAASLFERACREGEARACTSLGAMAQKGETGKADASWASALYDKACKGGDTEGCEKLKAMTAPAPQTATEEAAPASDATPATDESDSETASSDATPAPETASTPADAFVPTAHPSFDCAAARNEAERLICSDEDLAARDVAMARLYRRARNHAVDEGAVIAEQRDWIALHRNACTSKECLYRTYRHRARELEDWIP